jgi:hypothetical protein
LGSLTLILDTLSARLSGGFLFAKDEQLPPDCGGYQVAILFSQKNATKREEKREINN